MMWRTTIIKVLDVLLGVYLLLAMTAFNKPDESRNLCTKVDIDVQDESANGFIDGQKIKERLTRKGLYPLGKTMSQINTRQMEEVLAASPFVNKAECFKTEDGGVHVVLTQRMPVVRVKSLNGDDYYVDDNNRIMPNSHYTSDLIIATGYITPWFARNCISTLAKALMDDKFWACQIEQINVLPNRGVELVPRVGNHVVYLGQMPESKYHTERDQLIRQFVERKMERLKKFYLYGLSVAGWNKYAVIDLEFDNQIICKKHNATEQE